MREIKFRVWDKYHRIFSILEISNKNCGCQWKQIPETVFDQYTGLHDRNGKEIYDGDILKFHQLAYFSRTSEHYDDAIASVIWSHGGFTLHVIQRPLHTLDMEKGEVIGNIYQDKHLLEK